MLASWSERKPELTLESPASGLACDLTKIIAEAIGIAEASGIARRRMVHDVSRIDPNLNGLRFRKPESLADTGIQRPA